MKIISSLILALITLPLSFAADACCTTVPATDAGSHHTDASLFNVESNWENQDGATAPLSQLGDRAQIVALVYTTCKFACPRIIADLKSIESELESVTPEQLGYCLITIDPDRDTIAVYNDYAKIHELSSDRWSFLRGDAGDILEIANLLNVKYKKTQDGEFSHSNVLTLLNTQGEVVHQLVGLGADPEETIKAVHTLLEQS